MIRVFIVTAGSRGDTEPFFALASGLAKLPNVQAVTLMVPKNYHHLTPRSPKINSVALRFDLDDMPDLVSKDATSSVGYALKNMLLPDADLAVEHARTLEPTIVITSIFGFLLADIVRNLLRTPFVILHPQPFMASAYYPNVIGFPQQAITSFRLLREGKFEEARNDTNFETHDGILHIFLRNEVLEAVNVIREKYSVPHTSTAEVRELLSGRLENTHVLQATQSLLFTLAPDASPRAHIVGSFAAGYLPPNWNGEEMYPELTKFLNAGVKPVLITYGSMAADGAAAQVVRALLSGLRDAQVERVVLLPGFAKLGLHLLDVERDAELLRWAEHRVFVTKGSVQYAWLLPKCEMVLCHCGAGTTSAALRAGVPMLGTPVIADQRFYIEMLSQMNMGVLVGDTALPSITAQAVKDGVLKIRESGALETTRAYAEKEARLNEGVGKACAVIEQICADVDKMPADKKSALNSESSATNVAAGN